MCKDLNGLHIDYSSGRAFLSTVIGQMAPAPFSAGFQRRLVENEGSLALLPPVSLSAFSHGQLLHFSLCL